MKYKGYELLKAIADGEIKDGSKVIAPNDMQYTYNGNAFKDENGNFMNEEFSDCEYAMFDFELIEDEIDIDSIEELKSVTNNIHGTICMMSKINELVQAVKQINKEVKEMENKMNGNDNGFTKK